MTSKLFTPAGSRAILLFLLQLLFVVESPYAGGPWAQGKGKGFVQLAQSVTQYNFVFDQFGNSLNTHVKYFEGTTQLYGEFGISGRITLKAQLPYKWISATPESIFLTFENLRTWGGISAGVSALLINKKWKLAGKMDITLPGKGNSVSSEFLNIRSGYLYTEIAPWISTGTSGKKYYTFFEIGYGIGDVDVIKIQNEFGYSISNSLKLSLVLDGRIPIVHLEDEIIPVTSSFLYDPYQEYIGIGSKIFYESKKRFGLSGSVMGALMAKRVAKAPAWQVGIFYKW